MIKIRVETAFGNNVHASFTVPGETTEASRIHVKQCQADLKATAESKQNKCPLYQDNVKYCGHRTDVNKFTLFQEAWKLDLFK